MFVTEDLKMIFNKLNNIDIKALNIKEIEAYNPKDEYLGIKAITFDGLKFKDTKTKVFAYIGFPNDVKANIPAVVLVHGGAGYPFLKWVREWNKRGYAAIAVSTVGVFPKRVNAGDVEGAIDIDWTHELNEEFKEEGYIAAPDNDDMRNRDNQDVSEMWMYHAISQVILASVVIRSYDCVDETKIGAVGISWGSVILSNVIGYKNSFSFAINVFGSGFLTESLSFMRYKFILPTVQDLWLAEKNFDNVKIPVLWICMNNDNAFSANSNSKSYLSTYMNNAATTLSIKENWVHGHSSSWDEINYPCSEIYQYADSIVFGKDFPRISDFSKKIDSDRCMWATFKCRNNADVKATLFYSKNEYEYSIPLDMTKSHIANEWEKIDGIIKGENAFATIPEQTKVCYLELKMNNEGKNIVITTPLYIFD